MIETKLKINSQITEMQSALTQSRLTTLSVISEAENPEPQPENKRGRLIPLDVIV